MATAAGSDLGFVYHQTSSGASKIQLRVSGLRIPSRSFGFRSRRASLIKVRSCGFVETQPSHVMRRRHLASHRYEVQLVWAGIGIDGIRSSWMGLLLLWRSLQQDSARHSFLHPRNV